MATRTLTFREWFKLAVKLARDDGSSNLSGYPIADVAAKLNVSRQRVYQLIEEGALDTLAITALNGRAALVIVTEASLERYLSERVPDRGRQGYFAFPA